MTTSLCAPQPRFQKVVNLLVGNRLGTELVDAGAEAELCVPSQIVEPPFQLP